MTRRPPTSTARPGRVRIVAGKWRGRFLPVADLPQLRPTPERVRETLFNWLAPRLEGAKCLDLFAGTGVLGLEALSRGASLVVFVDNSARVVTSLQNAIRTLQATGARVHQGDAFDFLRRNKPEAMDIVFLDPPYADSSLAESCALLREHRWLAPGASVYMEQDLRQPVPQLPGGWTVRREKKAGNVRYLLVDVEKNQGGAR